METLSYALSRLGPAPCHKHECPNQARCAAEKLACDAFVQYVLSGVTMAPLVILPLGEVRRNARMGIRIIATREKYDSCDDL